MRFDKEKIDSGSIMFIGGIFDVWMYCDLFWRLFTKLLLLCIINPDGPFSGHIVLSF